jgi:hypothetical protein
MKLQLTFISGPDFRVALRISLRRLSTIFIAVPGPKSEISNACKEPSNTE